MILANTTISIPAVLRVLVIEDDPDLATLMESVLALQTTPRFELRQAQTLADGLRLLGEADFDAAVLDLGLPDSCGAATVTAVHTRAPRLPIVVFSGVGDEKTIHAAMRQGAQDYILKGRAIADILPRSILFAVDQKRAAIALRESEERYRAVVEDQSEVICRFRADGTFTFVNESYCRFFGKSPRELHGRKWSQVALADDVPGIEAQLRELSPAHPSVVIENRVRAASGQVHWLQFVNRGLFDPEGRLQEIQAVGRDITDLKKTEESLRQSQSELTAIYENAPTMMCVLNADRQVLYVNRAFAEFVGRPAEELKMDRACGVIGCQRSFDDPRGCGHGPACASCNVRLAMVDALATGRNHSGIEYRTTALCHGEPRDSVFLAAVAPIQMSGEPTLLLCLEDITDRKRSEDELRASRAQLRALASRLQAVREEDRIHVAREIHDVMAQELTRLKMVLTWLKGRLTRCDKAPATEEMVARVSEATGITDTVISSVQRIATALRPAVLDSMGLCAAVEWQARDFQEYAGIPCHADVPEGEWPMDRDVATAAFRILQESLTNVQRHAGATRVDVRLRYKKGQLNLRIKDNGGGIRPEALNSPLSIGLAGMRERALLLDGKFEIHSRPGAGTTIEVSLPLTGS